VNIFQQQRLLGLLQNKVIFLGGSLFYLRLKYFIRIILLNKNYKTKSCLDKFEYDNRPIEAGV